VSRISRRWGVSWAAGIWDRPLGSRGAAGYVRSMVARTGGWLSFRRERVGLWALRGGRGRRRRVPVRGAARGVGMCWGGAQPRASRAPRLLDERSPHGRSPGGEMAWAFGGRRFARPAASPTSPAARRAGWVRCGK
jgi:hypothetical protein